MNWFGPKLEPGERVLLRTPPRWVGWLIVGAVVASPAAMLVWIAFAEDDERLQHLVSMFYILGGLTAFQLLILVPMLRWRILATDRRILVRHGFLRREMEEIARDAVRAVRQDDHMIVIEGDGRRIETLCHPIAAGRLLDVIDPARAPEAPSGRATGGLPATDEPVLLRAKSQLAATLFPLLAATVPAGAVLFLDAPDITAVDQIKLVKILMFPAALLVVGAIVLFVTLRSGKQWMITGRRIVTIQGMFRRRIEDIRRDWIEESDFNGATLTVRGGGRRLDISLGESQVPAEDLHRVLGRWFPWRGAPVASVAELLRDGETLLLQRPRKWSRLAPFAVILLVLAAAAGYAWFRIGDARGFASLATPLLISIPLLAFLPQMLRESGWSLLVTDRRVLLRRSHDRSRYDELPLEAIDEIEAHTKIRPRVTLRAEGRRLEIPAPGTAKCVERIRETIAAAKEKSRWRG